MLTQEATAERVEAWKAVWNQYKDRISPNRKSGQEVRGYLTSRYPTAEFHDGTAARTVTENVLSNKPFADKLPQGVPPMAVTFIMKREGAGETLYENQDGIYKGMDIFVGIDLVSGFFCVEGSPMLWDELYAFRGLDGDDIQNYYCVAEYVKCLERFGLLEYTQR